MTTDHPYPKPPAQAAPYIEALGLEDTLKFIEAFGGIEIYIATHPSQASQVVTLVGYPKARALAEIADRLQRRVPLLKKWRAHVYASLGLPKSQIALKLGVTDVMVRNYLKDEVKPKTDTKQLPLF